MIHTPGWRRWLKELTQPSSSPELDKALENHKKTLPVLWLLGKTGAGKSSVIQRLSNSDRATVGNGFEPCTKTAMHFAHPAKAPILRFLDTRGLGEANYDPTEDLTTASQGSHALLLLTRVDDTAQKVLAEVLENHRKQLRQMPVLHIHTALHTLDEPARSRAIALNTQLIADALGRQPPTVSIDFTSPDDGFEDDSVGLGGLREAIIDLVPDLHRILSLRAKQDIEESLFLVHRSEILAYASIAAASDVFPAVGLLAVPTVQGKLLHALAGRYGIEWDRQLATEFIAAMGSGFLYRYALSLGGRQLGKLLPIYGQSAGAAAAATLSFASTYAIGRAACLYFHKKKHRQVASTEDLQTAFSAAFNERKKS